MKNVLFLMTAVFSILTILHTNVFAEGKADTTAPTGSVTINNGASSTNSPSVTLVLSATDDRGVTGYYVSESSTKPSASASGWTSITSTTSYSASVSSTLSSGDGNKTVYVWYKDAAGNVSSASSASITLTTISSTTPTPTATPIATPTATTTTTPITGHSAALSVSPSEVSLYDSLVVTVVDWDLNTSSSYADTGRVKIKSNSDTTGFILTLTETNVNSGSFKGTFMTADTTDSYASPPKIAVVADDTITVSYVDDLTAIGNSATITNTVSVTGTTGTPTPEASPTPTATETPPARGVIVGDVFDSSTGAPIAGATVSTDTGGYTATTGADGSYTMSDVETGTYTLTASATGYNSASGSVTVSAGAATAMSFSLSATAVVTPTPESSPTPTTTKPKISAGGIHTIALKSDGTVWAWGWNDSGQLGDGTNSYNIKPVKVSNIGGVTAIAGGGDHSIALNSDDTVWTWGYNAYGQLGDGTNIDRNTPVQVSNISGVTAIAGGNFHSIALKSDGTVWAWGNNEAGQLGDGTNIDRNTPVQVSNISGVTSIVGGYSHSIALKSDGTVWAWGNNTYGQLGDGTYTERNTPAQVSKLNGVKAIAGGCESYHNMALKSNGKVWAWGRNDYGQLGVDYDPSTPVYVKGLGRIKIIACGFGHSIALKSNGKLLAWGLNGSDQLGVDFTTVFNTSTPIHVKGLDRIKAITCGWDHSVALKSNGTVWAFGNNEYYQLGGHPQDTESTPIKVKNLNLGTSK